jgi:hypothetical protein
MSRRWLTRIALLGCLALCVVTWVGSYYQALYLHYTYTSGPFWTAGVFDGSFDIAYCDDAFPLVPGWDFNRTVPQHDLVRQEYRASQFHFLGFAFDHRQVASHVTVFWIPFWFPTLLIAILLLLNFRKPRPHPGGFPIEGVSQEAP